MITVYTKPGCMPCAGTKRELTKIGAPFAVLDVTVDADAAATAMSTPYREMPIVLVDHADGTQESWAGFRPDRIKAAADRVLDDLARATG